MLRDPQRKSIPRMAWEAVALWRAKGTRPSRYIRSLLYRRHIGDPAAFLSYAEYDAIRAVMSQSPSREVMSDKLLFFRTISESDDVRLPRHLGHTENGCFYGSDGEAHSLETASDLRCLLERLLDDVRSHGGTSLFAKPTEGTFGRGVFKVASPEPSPKLLQALRTTDYVLQQTVAQHPALAAVYPHSLNTMRITSCHPGSREPEVTSAWIRLGRGGAIVDGGNAGGFFAGIDLETGRLARFCGTLFDKGGKTFTHHPDTGHPLLGSGEAPFEVPDFAAACEMVRVAARLIEHPIIGWDVAISTKGPVIIEANSTPIYYFDEVANGGCLSNPILGPYFRDMLVELEGDGQGSPSTF